jgi:quinol monooxygenase YgiN
MASFAPTTGATPVEDSKSNNNYVTIKPYFRVTDWDAMLPKVQQIHDATLQKSNPGALHHHDWTKSNDQLLMRSTFTDAEALIANMDSLIPMIDELLSATAILDRFEIHGPESELCKIKLAHNNLDAEFYDSGSGFQTGFFSQSNDQVAQAEQDRLVCTCNPQFTIKNWAGVEPIMEQFMEVSSNEPNCLYFGWTKNNNTLYWHADFVNGEALKMHFQQVKPLLNALSVANGPAHLEHMEIHGPAAQLELIEESSDGYIDGLPVQYFITDSRVKRMARNFETLSANMSEDFM